MRIILFFLVFQSLAAHAVPGHAFKVNLSGFTKPAPPNSAFGIMGGAMSYNGDLNPTRLFDPRITHLCFGLQFKHNFDARWSFRLTASRGAISGNDAYISTSLSQSRNASFSSTIWEASTGIEFNFFPLNPLEEKVAISPYLHVGVGGFLFDPKYQQNNQLIRETPENNNSSTMQFSLPFGVGIKYQLSSRFVLATEWSFRKTWTDYLDGVSTFDPQTGLQRGDSKHDDWYQSVAVILMIRVGKLSPDCPAVN